ncbi:MAG: hypothetical protein FWE01_01040 [Firmicutes bacterium]|nr:hypothetical protein [Bacillota bacterium]
MNRKKSSNKIFTLAMVGVFALCLAVGSTLIVVGGVSRADVDDTLSLYDIALFVRTTEGINNDAVKLLEQGLNDISAQGINITNSIITHSRLFDTFGFIRLTETINAAGNPGNPGIAADIPNFTSRVWVPVYMENGVLTLWMTGGYRNSTFPYDYPRTNVYATSLARSNINNDFSIVRGHFPMLDNALFNPANSNANFGTPSVPNGDMIFLPSSVEVNLASGGWAIPQSTFDIIGNRQAVGVGSNGTWTRTPSGTAAIVVSNSIGTTGNWGITGNMSTGLRPAIHLDLSAFIDLSNFVASYTATLDFNDGDDTTDTVLVREGTNLNEFINTLEIPTRGNGSEWVFDEWQAYIETQDEDPQYKWVYISRDDWSYHYIDSNIRLVATWATVIPPTNFTALQNLINYVDTNIIPNLTNFVQSGTIVTFNNALNNARYLTQNIQDVTQGQVDNVYTTLQSAINGLTPLPNRGTLNHVINIAQLLNAANHIQDTQWNEFTTALSNAIAGQINMSLYQSGVDALVDALQLAMENVNLIPPTDSSALVSLVTHANTLDTNNFIYNQTIVAFVSALENAENILALTNPVATQDQINYAYTVLRAALNNLVYRPNTIVLSNIIYTAQNLVLSDFIQNETITTFTNVLVDAEALVINISATQDQINAMVSLLQSAINNLVPLPEIDKLENLVAYANKIDDEYFKQDGYWAVFTVARSNAASVLVNPLSTQAQIDAAILDLKTAIQNLNPIEDNGDGDNGDDDKGDNDSGDNGNDNGDPNADPEPTRPHFFLTSVGIALIVAGTLAMLAFLTFIVVSKAKKRK